MKLSTGWLSAVLLILQLVHIKVLAQLPKGYNLGDAITDFQVKNIDGHLVSLADYRSGKGLIVVFTSNHCPFSKTYEDRLIALDRKFAVQGYPVLAIVPNDPVAYEEDSFDNMKIRAHDRNYPYAYALDETQSVARVFGATRTPQVYVLKQTNNQFILEYVGAIDDSPQDSAGAQRRYVEEAVNNLVLNRPVQSPITKPIGCAIKWK